MIPKPILLDPPIPITTPRLLMRPPRPGDGKKYNEAMQESFKELHEWLPWAQEMESLDESEEFARQASADWILRKELGLWIYDKASDDFLAAAWFHKIDWSIPRLELGYWLRSSKTGSGLMAEAVNALTRYAFEVIGAKRLEIHCDKENVKSRAVAERLDYKLDAIFAQNEINLDGTRRDTCVYSRLDANGLPKLEISWGHLGAMPF
jgi:RimJ/RimL family protein N-acetyltransferase